MSLVRLRSVAALASWSAALALTGCMQTSASVTTGYAPVDEPYRLDAGDKLRIVVYGQEGLTNTYAVGASGAINSPLTSRLMAKMSVSSTSACRNFSVSSDCLVCP